MLELSPKPRSTIISTLGATSKVFFPWKVDWRRPSRLSVRPLVKGRAKSSPASALNWWRTFLQPFLGNMEESLSVCATAAGAHQPFHTCPLCLSAMKALHKVRMTTVKKSTSVLLVPPFYSGCLVLFSPSLFRSHLNSLLSLGERGST